MWIGWPLSVFCIVGIFRVARFRIVRSTDDSEAIGYAGGREQPLAATEDVISRQSSQASAVSPIERLLASKGGWYKDKDRADRALDNLVLVTASNSAFRVFLDNWECQTNRLGLKYVVLSMDDQLQSELGPDRSFIIHNYSAEERWGTRDYNSITCSKISGVLRILEAGYDVIFSDPDNMLAMDPLTHDLGNLIRFGRYDYLYQTQPSRKKAFLKCAFPIAKSGNIGFTYTKNSARARQLYRDTLQACQEEPEFSAQISFWNVLRWGLDEPPDARARFKPQKAWCSDDENDSGRKKRRRVASDDEDTLRLCCLNTTHYREGYRSPKVDPLVVFHANWVKGNQQKIDLLRKNKMWFLDANGTCPSAAS